MVDKVLRGFRCTNCRTPFKADVIYNVGIKKYLAHMAAIKCPSCGSTSFSMGMNLDLQEDHARRDGTTLEERLKNWLEHGDVGDSSSALMHYMKQAKEPQAYPHDWNDLRRVILLIDRIPEWRSRMKEMSQFKGWTQIGKRYEEIVEAALKADPTLRSPTSAIHVLKGVYHR